jgi:hypothetical protein
VLIRKTKSKNSAASKINAPEAPPKTYITKVATMRLQYTPDHYVAFNCFTFDYKPVLLLLSAKEATSSAKISDAVLNFGLYYSDAASLEFQAKRAAHATAGQRGIIVISNGWLDDSHKQFVFGDRVLSARPKATAPAEDLIVACPGFDTGQNANLAGSGSVPLDAAVARRPKGSIKGWKKGVAQRALNSSAMITTIAAAFAAPLLGPMDVDPFIILIAGDNSGGKTTTLMATGSVIGISRKSQLPNWKATDAGLELQVQVEYADMVFPIDELSHVGTDSKVFEKLDAAAYFFDAGASKKKHNRAAEAVSRRPSRPSGTRSIVVTSYEKTLAEIEAAVERAFRGGVGVRLVEIPMTVSTGAEGIFDRLPKEAGTDKKKTAYANKLAKDVRRACKKNNGKVFVAWIKKLLTDLGAAQTFVRARMEKFISKADFNRSNRPEYRHAEHFAFLYGAGAYAIECGFLPWSRGQLLKAVMKCYRASRASLTGKPDPRASLMSDLMQHLDDAKRVIAWPKVKKAANNGPDVDGWKRQDGDGTFYRIKTTAFRRWFPSSPARTVLEQELVSKKILILGKKGKFTFQERAPKSETRVGVYHLRVPAGTS